MSQKTIKDIRVLHSEINKQQLNSSYFRLLHSRSSTHFPDLTYGHQFVSHMSCSSWLEVIKMSHSDNVFFDRWCDEHAEVMPWTCHVLMPWGHPLCYCPNPGCHIVTRTESISCCLTKNIALSSSSCKDDSSCNMLWVVFIHIFLFRYLPLF